MHRLIAGLLMYLCCSAQALELQGELRQGGMVWGVIPSGSQLWLDDQAVKVASNGRFVFGFGRDAKPTATLRVVTPEGEEIQQLTIAQREYNIQRVNGVPQRTVTPSKESLERIRRESQQVRAARALDTERQDFAQPFQWPLLGPVTGVFGSQRVYNGKPGRPHYGVDVARPTGTQVVAPVSGRVTLVHPDMFYSGGTLVIDHGQGVSSTFIHLSKVLVEEGAEVAAGDPIAEVGASGRATGPHLDWRMNWFNVRLDPQLMVGEMPTAELSAVMGDASEIDNDR